MQFFETRLSALTTQSPWEYEANSEHISTLSVSYHAQKEIPVTFPSSPFGTSLLTDSAVQGFDDPQKGTE